MKNKRPKTVKQMSHGNLSDELQRLRPPRHGEEPLVSVILRKEGPTRPNQEGLPIVPEGEEPIVLEPQLNFLKENEVLPLITTLLHLWNDPDFWVFLLENPQPNSTDVGQWISQHYLTIPTECPSADQWREMVTNPTIRIAFFGRLLTYESWSGVLPPDESDETIAHKVIGNAGSRKVVQSSDPLARQLCDLVQLYVEAPSDVVLRERMQEILAPRGKVNNRTREVASRLAKDLASFAQSKQELPRFHLFLAKRAGHPLELKTARAIENMVKELIKNEDAGEKTIKKLWSKTSERGCALKAERLLKARGRVVAPSADQTGEESWLETLYRQETGKKV
jgi:hypothetical protein